MNFESPKDKEHFGINEAMLEIQGLEQQVMGMGANDYEPSAFVRVRERLSKGELTPEQAVHEARNIINGKQDYH